MARVLEFGGTVVVTDIEVTEPITPEGSIEADFAKQIIKATAIYEGAVYESRKKLEQAVIDARTSKTAAEQIKVKPDPA